MQKSRVLRILSIFPTNPVFINNVGLRPPVFYFIVEPNQMMGPQGNLFVMEGRKDRMLEVFMSCLWGTSFRFSCPILMNFSCFLKSLTMGRDGGFSSVKFQLKWRFLPNSRIFVKLSRFLKSPLNPCLLLFSSELVGLRPPVFNLLAQGPGYVVPAHELYYCGGF